MTTLKISNHIFIPLLVLLLLPIMVYSITQHLNQENYVFIQENWFINLNQFLNKTLNISPFIWSNLTHLGDALVGFLLLSFLIIRQPTIWAGFFSTIPLAAIFSIIGKNITAIPRPAAVLDHDSFVIIGNTISAHTSLPSGHTISVFSIITVLLLSKKHNVRYWIIGLFIALILSLSRIAVGAHWPLDIVAGGALGYLAGFGGVALAQRYSVWWLWLQKDKYAYLCALFLTLLIVALLRKLPTFELGNIVIWIGCLCGLFTLFKLLKISFSTHH